MLKRMIVLLCRNRIPVTSQEAIEVPVGSCASVAKASAETQNGTTRNLIFSRNKNTGTNKIFFENPRVSNKVKTLGLLSNL